MTCFVLVLVYRSRTRTYNFDETCLSLTPTGSNGWWLKGENQKPQFQKPTKQAVTVTLDTSAVRAHVAAHCIVHGTTERVVPDLTTDVWMTNSHNHWASTDARERLNTGRVTRFSHCKDWQIVSSFSIQSIVVHGPTLFCGKSSPGVEPAAEFDSTQENSPGQDTVRIDRLIALS